MGLRITKRKDRWPEYVKAAPDVAREIEERHTKDWAYVMIQIMPEDTGAMKRSTEAVPNKTNRGWGVRIGVDYWRYVNNGTIFQNGQFFVEESRELIRPAFKRDVKGFCGHVRRAA
jgi:hypothetical protein